MQKHNKRLTLTNLFYILLFLWYSLIFFDIPLLTTEGHANPISMYGLLGLFLAILLVGFLLRWNNIHSFGLLILLLWGFLQFNANWKYLLMKPSEEKIQSYYQHFEHTLRFFPVSDQIIIPDAYHTILGGLLFINIVLVSRKILLKFI
ncbi:MAG: hypothetical protein V2I54_07455 [Bacteroidales bacterium]|jgi:hypothetical protein|nr:hypothetical protein [Bacteroidales bacterium]